MTRRSVLVLVWLTALAWAQGSFAFHNTEMKAALTRLGNAMGLRVFLAPQVQGRVEGTFGPTPERALRAVLRGTGWIYRIEAGVLAVGPAEVVRRLDLALVARSMTQRRHFRLNQAPADKVCEFLSGQYRQVQFEPDATGFTATGPAGVLETLARVLPALDRLPPSPSP